jgi:hypothetical protein
MQDELTASGLFSEVLLEVMPDPFTAKESIWIPHLRDVLRADHRTVMIGHSSGAEATMRFLETNKLFGAVLVSACHTDLGDEHERASGYYSRPWLWETIKGNVDPAFGILQYHSTDDPLVPYAEGEHVALSLGSEFTTKEDASHFFSPEDVEDVAVAIIAKIRSCTK